MSERRIADVDTDTMLRCQVVHVTSCCDSVRWGILQAIKPLGARLQLWTTLSRKSHVISGAVIRASDEARTFLPPQTPETCPLTLQYKYPIGCGDRFTTTACSDRAGVREDDHRVLL
jgi:hypothetical protein